MKRQNIFIVGFPYVRESYFATFRYFSEKERLFFLLPRIWKAKKGKVIFKPPQDKNIYTTSTFFYHSSYSIVGGWLKGWMPFFPIYLAYMKWQKGVGLVYSCSEPHLLTTLYNAFWTKVFGVKHIMFSWENIPYWEKFYGLNRWLKMCVIRTNLSLSEGLICGNKKCEEIYKEICNKYKMKKKIEVIPMNGVDEEFFKPSHLKSKIFKEHDWAGKVVFTFVGAIGYRKGLDSMLEAFSQILDKLENAHLVIAGTGEYEENVKLKIKNLKLVNYITRIPWVSHEDLVGLLNASDVFLYPSISYGGWEEQFGYSMAEASLMELPVISTKSGSIEEVVKDGVTGVLVTPDDPGDLTKAMIKLGSDSGLRQKLGQSGREYILSNFSHQEVAEKFKFFFELTLRH